MTTLKSLAGLKPSPEMLARSAGQRILGAVVTRLVWEPQRVRGLPKSLLCQFQGSAQALIVKTQEYRAAKWLAQ